MQEAAKLERDDALDVELKHFVEMARTSVARALVGVFLADQQLGRKAKHWEKQAERKVAQAAVLGRALWAVVSPINPPAGAYLSR